MVLYCWLRRAGCISQDTYLLYDNDNDNADDDYDFYDDDDDLDDDDEESRTMCMTMVGGSTRFMPLFHPLQP